MSEVESHAKTSFEKIQIWPRKIKPSTADSLIGLTLCPKSSKRLQLPPLPKSTIKLNWNICISTNGGGRKKKSGINHIWVMNKIIWDQISRMKNVPLFFRSLIINKCWTILIPKKMGAICQISTKK